MEGILIATAARPQNIPFEKGGSDSVIYSTDPGDPNGNPG
jgi:hypothetical protein